jgi:hypothetical protein
MLVFICFCKIVHSSDDRNGITGPIITTKSQRERKYSFDCCLTLTGIF